MRITCRYCGPRSVSEFVYRGDATVARPNADPSQVLDAPARQRWVDYVYLRENPAGVHRELWQHTAGCRAWLVVTRDTATHAISGVEAASDVARRRGGSGSAR
jgi:heterotetrameric sarcosine oxidase delta subunit